MRCSFLSAQGNNPRRRICIPHQHTVPMLHTWLPLPSPKYHTKACIQLDIVIPHCIALIGALMPSLVPALVPSLVRARCLAVLVDTVRVVPETHIIVYVRFSSRTSRIASITTRLNLDHRIFSCTRTLSRGVMKFVTLCICYFSQGCPDC